MTKDNIKTNYQEFVLMPARHRHPSIEGLYSFFDESIDPFDIKLTHEARTALASTEHTTILIYVTGLTQAVDVAVQLGEYTGNKIILLHYDRASNDYRRIDALSVLSGYPSLKNF